ncbi:hypothetical protein THIX_30653 [Thiomonas sp. X19]|nr:hypothetical protein THIX_30653 [Thiomonas sp. X19]
MTCSRRTKIDPGVQPNLLPFEAQEFRSDHHGHDWQDPAVAFPPAQIRPRDCPQHGSLAQHGSHMVTPVGR